jgi:dihydrofolate reductase
VFRLSRLESACDKDITSIDVFKRSYSQRHESSNPIFIIGGGEVYKETLKDVSVIMLTRIHAKAEKVDTWYPDFLSERRPKYCTESSRHTDEKTGLEYSFHIYGYDKEDLKNFLRHKAKRGKDAAAKNTEKSLASQSRVPSTR